MRLNERASCRPSRTKSKHGNDDDGDNDDNDDDLQRAGVTDGQSGDAGTAVAGSELRRTSSNIAGWHFLPSFLPSLPTADDCGHFDSSAMVIGQCLRVLSWSLLVR